MEKVQVEEFRLFGVTVRTSNENEMTPQGKIGPLWQSVMGQLGEKGVSDAVVYGVYSSYETEDRGAYDCSAAIGVSVGLEDESVVTIPAGTYLRFEASGECPAACLGLWQEIWHFFENNRTVRRRYAVDFEEYRSKTEVAIYVGILDDELL